MQKDGDQILSVVKMWSTKTDSVLKRNGLNVPSPFLLRTSCNDNKYMAVTFWNQTYVYKTNIKYGGH